MKWTVESKAAHAGLRREVVRDGGDEELVGGCDAEVTGMFAVEYNILPVIVVGPSQF